jgi:hypothetical protein
LLLQVVALGQGKHLFDGLQAGAVAGEPDKVAPPLF